MNLKIITGDLFEICDEEGGFPVHCISADKAMGAGIAVPMSKKYNLRTALRNKKLNVGDCVFVNGVFNLITKEKYYEKPTLFTLNQSLDSLVNICKEQNIKKICMPKIGCGLDRLCWDIVFKSIYEKFEPLDIEIIIVLKE